MPSLFSLLLALLAMPGSTTEGIKTSSIKNFQGMGVCSGDSIVYLFEQSMFYFDIRRFVLMFVSVNESMNGNQTF